MTAASAVVRVAWTPGRREPSHRSELVTQWLCGERLAIEEENEDGWVRVTGPDGYASWVDRGGLVRLGDADADRWEEEADRISLGTELQAVHGEGESGGAGGGEARPAPPRYLPWGARVAAPEGDRESADHRGHLRLPGGTRAVAAAPDRLVAREECVLRFPPRADALLATAAAWIGVPYLWGGRTREGADCSGYLQAVLALHGRPLPRDSDLQAEADEAVWASGDGDVDLLAVAREVLRPGDLLFFGGPEDGSGNGTASGHEGGVTHVALAAGDTEILHAAAGRGQVQRDDLASGDPLMERLRARLAAVTRPLGRDDGARGEEDDAAG